MKDIIKKSALMGLVGVPVFIVSYTVSLGIMKGIKQSIERHKKSK